jgi:glycosyltransferase involved in cell wall biosynthesis
MDLLFSIIIPAYNSESYVIEAIDSALFQRGVNFEIIVVNDGSTDETLSILKTYGNRIHIVDQENKGLSGARNSGAHVAKGNVLAFLDADDIWSPDKLLLQSYKINAGYGMVYTNRFNFGQSAFPEELLSDKLAMKEGDIWYALLHMNMITASSVVIMKDIYVELGGFREDLRSCEDWDLWLRCAETHKIGYCPEPLLKYRIHQGGLSKKYVFMSKMRELVILSSLSSPRGRTLSATIRRKILAKTWSTSAWSAAEGKDVHQALIYYSKALFHWPFNGTIWYDILRTLLGRI